MIEDVECSCDAGNKLWDFGFWRYFPLLDGCVDFYRELIDSFAIRSFGIFGEGEVDVVCCFTDVLEILPKVLNNFC